MRKEKYISERVANQTNKKKPSNIVCVQMGAIKTLKFFFLSLLLWFLNICDNFQCVDKHFSETYLLSFSSHHHFSFCSIHRAQSHSGPDLNRPSPTLHPNNKTIRTSSNREFESTKTNQLKGKLN